MSHETHHHRIYFLTCGQYDALFRYADEACMRCGRDDVRLQIDHDHAAGWEAVRGLVCARCNTRIARAERGEKTMDVLSWRYLQEAWWRRARPELHRWSAWGSGGQPWRPEVAA